MRPPPRPTLFPYTTLFRSGDRRAERQARRVARGHGARGARPPLVEDRKSTRLNSSHVRISYAVFCLKKKNLDITSPQLMSLHENVFPEKVSNVHVLAITNV